MTSYRPVPPQVELPALEREVLDFWHEQTIFEKSVARNEGAETWTGKLGDERGGNDVGQKQRIGYGAAECPGRDRGKRRVFFNGQSACDDHHGRQPVDKDA